MIRHTIERTNLKFRELLRELDDVGKATSKELASRLGKPVKEISNDLRRMRGMKFVKADREKRMCASRWIMRGNYYRGFQYRYYLSEQGKSYLNWMNKVKPAEDSIRSLLMNALAAHLPSNVKMAILVHHVFSTRAPRKYKGPSSRSRFLADLALTKAVLSGEPAPLELETIPTCARIGRTK